MNGLPDRTYAVYLGLDVGKEHHHACALDTTGKRLHDKTLPQDEQRIRELLTELSAHGNALIVVDQPASIGALPVAAARSMNIQVAYLPGLAMRRIADLHPGNAKTDARDAYIIADAARTLPHALRRVDVGDDALADLEVIVGLDDNLSAETTRVTNRIHGLLTQIHPALERAIGGSLHHPAILELLSRFGGPTGLRAAGRRRMLAVAKPRAPRKYEAFVDAIMTALDEQTVTVPGTKTAELVLPKLADQLAGLLKQRADAAKQVEKMLAAHPLAQGRGYLPPAQREGGMSMPGVGVRTGARILLEVGDASSFATPGHLAAYAGLAPVTRRSGSSIRDEHPSRRGNKNLKRALFLAAFAALKDPASVRITTANAPKVNDTTPPSSASPAAAATCCTRCSETEPSTNP